MSYEESVLAIFQRLHDVSWPVFIDNDFWHTANTLDTCVDFVLEGSKAWKDFDRYQQVQTMVENSYLFFNKKYDEQNGGDRRSPDVWWDDYGWWGITFTKLYQHYSDVFKGLESPKVTRPQCLEVARKCWTALGSYSDEVNRSVQPPLKGPVEGGVWNHPPKPKTDPVKGGIQNTVTNGLYLALSARLYQNTKEQAFLDATASQYLWFRNWFTQYLQKPDQCQFPGIQEGLFRCLQSAGNDRLYVIYERPIDPKNPDYNQGDPPFAKDQWWAGDQGLLLGGLAAVLDSQQQIKALPIIQKQDPTFPKSAEDMFRWTANGISWLFDPTGVLHESKLNGTFRTDFAADMATGKGVMMRYLYYALKKAGVDPKNYIERSAAALIRTEGDAHQVNFQWNERTDTKIGTNEKEVLKTDPRFDPTSQSAGLDALNAGIQYLKESAQPKESAAD